MDAAIMAAAATTGAVDIMAVVDTTGAADITDAEVPATRDAASQAAVLAVDMRGVVAVSAVTSEDLPEAAAVADLRAVAVAAGFMATLAADSMAVEEALAAAVAVSTEVVAAIAVEGTAAGIAN